MFDLGWSEMGIVLLVALLVLGPKEMPKLARDLGRWVGKARALAREFQRSLEDMARETELEDVKKQIDDAGRELRRPQLTKRLEREVDPDGELSRAFEPERDGQRRGRSEDGRRDSDDTRGAPKPARDDTRSDEAGEMDDDAERRAPATVSGGSAER